MYCLHCGQQLPDNAVFCGQCGQAVHLPKETQTGGGSQGSTFQMYGEPPAGGGYQSPYEDTIGASAPQWNGAEPSEASAQHKPQRWLIIAIGAILALGLITAAVLIFSQFAEPKERPIEELSLEELLKKAEQSLYDGDYEEAVLAYEAALNIDPKLENAYLGLADAYEKSGQPEQAEQILKNGILQLKDSVPLRAALGEYLDEDAILRMIAQRYGEDIAVTITQIDTSQYPLIRVYVDARNAAGEAVDDLKAGFFYLSERLAEDGSYVRRKVDNVLQLDGAESISINLVADVSGSMAGDPLYRVKQIMHSFMDTVQFDVGDMVELISFDEALHMENQFTNDKSQVYQNIDNLWSSNGATALYDALVGALYKTVQQNGAKVIIAFTDGIDNRSRYTPTDVVQLSDTYKIPIFIIGIGNDLEMGNLSYIADSSGGFFRNIADVDAGLQEIYHAIYTLEKEQYVVEYTSEETAQDADLYRDIVIELVSEAYTGKSDAFVYEPQAHYGFFNGQLLPNGDPDPELFILELDQRYISAAELDQFTYEQIRYIRNGLYALSGKKFKKQQFIQYFNSKQWYSPYANYVEDDRVVVRRFNTYQKENWDTVIAYEKVRGWR